MPFVKRNRPNVLNVLSKVKGGQGIFIKPGVNSLTPEELAICKDNRGFMACVKSGAIELMDEKSPAKQSKTGVEAIKGMSVKDAKKIIAEILNKEDLEAILEADSRKGIQDAVEDQLDKLRIDDDEDEE